MQLALHFNFDTGESRIPAREEARRVQRYILRQVRTCNACYPALDVATGPLMLNCCGYGMLSVAASGTWTWDEERSLSDLSTWQRIFTDGWFHLGVTPLSNWPMSSIYVCRLSGLDRAKADAIGERMNGAPYYLGACEIDVTSSVHRALYCGSLTPRFFLSSLRKAAVMVPIDSDEFYGDERRLLRRCGFDDISTIYYAELDSGLRTEVPPRL